MKKIAIFTTTRSDISILIPLIKKIRKSKKMNYLLFVGGTHLNKNYGNTKKEILLEDEFHCFRNLKKSRSMIFLLSTLDTLDIVVVANAIFVYGLFQLAYVAIKHLSFPFRFVATKGVLGEVWHMLFEGSIVNGHQERGSVFSFKRSEIA